MDSAPFALYFKRRDYSLVVGAQNTSESAVVGGAVAGVYTRVVAVAVCSVIAVYVINSAVAVR